MGDFQKYYILSMSHFISGVNLEGSLIFHMTPPQIVKPKMKRFLKSNALEAFFSRKSEERIIDHVCHRYSQMEEENLKVEKELFISNKCSVLKKKFKSAFNTNASGKSVQNFFVDETLTLEERVHKFQMNLKELSSKMPRRLQLQKKYNSTINIKMISIQEAELINRQKEEYRQWLNEINNRANSPNLNKMAFLFQKLSKKKRNLRTESSQITEPAEMETEYVTSRRDPLKCDFLLKENDHQRSYAKLRKPYTSLDKQRNRLSGNNLPHCRY